MNRVLILFLASSILSQFSIAQYIDSDYTDLLHGPRGISVIIANADPENSRFDSSSSDESEGHEERGPAAGYDEDYDDPHATEPDFNDFDDEVRHDIVAGGNNPDADYDDYDTARPVDPNDF
ncbi:hypothetical protein AAVH_08175 [Aphelenchoides avenae]|nr:hypothetical protein AAVH_08175 [Aphelenchus avenae]